MSKLFRALTTICLLAASARAQTNGAADTDTLLLRNGDRLAGRLQAIEPSGRVLWQHPDTSAPIPFKLDAVAQIDFPPRKNTAARQTNACRLVLWNGESLEGRFASCDRTNLALDTWYAGTLNIPRAAVQTLVFESLSPEVFNGITGIEGWTQGAAKGAPGAAESGKWIYRNGAFYADKAASIARDLKLPDVAQIQFDLAWTGGLNLAVALYTDSLLPILLTAKDDAPDFGGFYSLRFLNSSFIDLWPIQRRQPMRALGQVFFPALNQKTRMRVDIRVSKPLGKISLLIDGAPVKEWIDPAGFVGQGTGVRFVQNSAGGGLKLSNLRVTEWDGLSEDAVSETNATATDKIWLFHGAPVTGTIGSVTGESLVLSTNGGSARIPLAGVRSIDFAKSDDAAAPVAAKSRAVFATGGSLHLDVDEWTPAGLTVHGAVFGAAKINPEAFTRLQFAAPTPPADTGGRK